MAVLFAITLFLSATLLFLVEPMIAKMILPKFGGTPAVWNTCMVFFQAILLAGYAYVHVTTTWLGVRRQALLHLGVLLLPALAFTLPVTVTQDPPGDADPILWLLWLLLISVGLPFFVVCTLGPLLQKWFASTKHASAKDPYFLYAASNLGSMMALLAYPVLMEPSLVLKNQSWVWAGGYALLVVLTAACAVVVLRTHPDAEEPDAVTAPGETSSPRGRGQDSSQPLLADSPRLWRRVRWIALSFIPSSFMLGVTAYLSTDISPFPLIWVIPLAIYLLSFILVFSKLPAFVHRTMVLFAPVLILLLLMLMMQGATTSSKWVDIALHLTTLFAVAMVCHGELARDRPAPRFLTEFYLWMSLGGVLGGMFNALLAPILFSSFVEYPLVMVFACLLSPRSIKHAETPTWHWLDLVLPLAMGVFTAGLILNFQCSDQLVGAFFRWFKIPDSYLDAPSMWLADHMSFDQDRMRKMLTYGLPTLLCYSFVDRPIRFGLGIGAILLAVAFFDLVLTGNIIHRERSFFGALKIVKTQDSHLLKNGYIDHGRQRIDKNGLPVRNSEPSTYYHRQGGIGQVFKSLAVERRRKPMALIGLGTGSLAYYGVPQQEATYYEIDRGVVALAQNPNYFTYWDDAVDRGVELSVTLGDARLSLKEFVKTHPHHYELIVVDAFSSDAIPVHLITREALRLYQENLTENGIIAFHISNRYLNLEPVCSNLIDDTGWVGLIQHDGKDDSIGKSESTWVILAKDERAFGSLLQDIKHDKDDQTKHWTRFSDKKLWDPDFARSLDVGLWTDDYSNILKVMIWR